VSVEVNTRGAANFAVVDDARRDSESPTLDEWRARAGVFAGVAAFRQASSPLVRAGEGPMHLSIAMVTPDFFDVLGVAGPALETWGNVHPDTDADVPIVLTAAGRRRLALQGATNPRMLRGSDGRVFRIVGALPSGFLFPNQRFLNVEAVTVFRQARIVPAQGCCVLHVVARLQPGAALDAARAAVTRPLSSGRALDVRVTHLSDEMRGDLGPLAFGALAAALLVLLIAAGNVGNLLIVRAAYRAGEFKTRAALGASRADLVRLAMVELAVLTLAATVTGLGLSSVVVRIAAGVIPVQYVTLAAPAVTGRAVVFALVAGLGIAAPGLVPALMFSRVRWGRDAGLAGRARVARVTFAAAQVALAVILAIGAGMLGRSYANLVRQDTGYDGESAYLRASYPFGSDGKAVVAEVARTVGELGRMPGVRAAGATDGSIVRDAQAMSLWLVRGQRVLTATYKVTPGFFGAAGMAVVNGRALEVPDADSAVVVNQAFVRAHWGSAPAVGRVLVSPAAMRSETPHPFTVVGVVGDAMAQGLADAAVPTVYRLLAPDRRAPSDVLYVVRMEGGAPPDARALRRAIWSVSADATVGVPETIAARFAETIRDRTFATLVLGLFELAAVVVSAAGLAAIVGFVVTRRTHEVAVRIALGAARRHVLRVVAAEAALSVALGGACGLLAGRALSHSLRALVFGIQPGDWTTTLASGGVAGAIMLAAALIPARRAACLPPAEALRIE
jgi:putative ABC transport system permease protein